MDTEIIVSKTENNGLDANIGQFEAKVPYEVEDSYGKKEIFYRKEIFRIDELLRDKTRLEEQLIIINDKISQAGKL